MKTSRQLIIVLSTGSPISMPIDYRLPNDRWPGTDDGLPVQNNVLPHVAVLACLLVEMSNATPILPNPISKKISAIHGVAAFKTANALLHKHRLIKAKIVGVKTAIITG